MPVALSAAVHEEIYQRIKAAFKDFALFDSLVDKRLRQVIADADRVEIDVKSTRKLTERYYDVQAFQTEKQKVALAQIHIILRTTYVLILSYHEHIKPLLFTSVDQLLQHYPEFQGQDDGELRFLLNFRNMLRVSLLVVPPRLNKQLLLKIAAHLEGSGKEYITGGGQKPCVCRRVLIYEREGNVRAEKRLDRIRPVRPGQGQGQGAAAGQKRKRPSAQPTSREVKLLRLASDEIRQINKEAKAGASAASHNPSPLSLDPDSSVDVADLEE
eukprot:gene43212-52824_t